MRHDQVLGPAVAGRWYPGSPHELADLVDGLLGNAAARDHAPARRVVSLVVPHAGFVYSGAVAATAFATIRGSSYDRIILLGPSHYFGFPGAAIPDAATAYRTPLGDLPFDGGAIAILRNAPGFRADDRVFEPEHSLESELPFLQRTLAADIPIVPVLLGGGASHDDARRIAEAIAPLLVGSVLVIVSSDFTHFGPRFDYVPFEDDVPDRLRALDMGAVAAIESGDADAFERYVRTTGATICGHRAIDVLLMLPGAAAGGKLLAYDTSGRMTGAWDNSVSYAAIAASGAVAP